jgi:TetR/AcrR family transcriptional regulator
MVKKSTQKTANHNPDTEQKILAAALMEFSEAGFAGGRMQSIATRAGVNKALAHYYFRSKEKLYGRVLQEIVLKLWGNIRQKLDLSKDAGDLRGHIRALVSAFIEIIRANPEFARLFFRELVDGGERLPGAFNLAFERVRDVPMRIVATYLSEVAAGNARKIHPVHFIINIMSMTIVPFLLKPVLEILPEKLGYKLSLNAAFFSERVEAITTMACDGILIKDKSR